MFLPTYFRSDDPKFVICHHEDAPENHAQPIIHYFGDVWLLGCKFEVWAEGHLLFPALDIMHAMELLLASHFAFNLEYAEKAKGTLMFLQRFIMNIHEGKKSVPVGVKMLMNKLT